jgi:hypothetical protein
MHLMYYMDADGKRVYTLKVCAIFTGLSAPSLPLASQFLSCCFLHSTVQKETPEGKPTQSAHPGEWRAIHGMQVRAPQNAHGHLFPITRLCSPLLSG